MLEMHFAFFAKWLKKNIKHPKSNVLNSMINTLLKKICLKNTSYIALLISAKGVLVN